MHHKKAGFAKSFFASLKRFFRARNIIIISEHKVEHVPLSSVMQILLLVGTVGLFSGVSYITGSYVSARSSIKEKERKIASTTIEKVHIGEQMDALKRDLVRLSQNGEELGAYGKFIIDSHDNIPGGSFNSATPNSQMFGQDENMVFRISYLEGRIHDIEDENEHLVTAVRARTEKKINDFEDIIAMTGLDSDKLEHTAAGKKDDDDTQDRDEKISSNAPVASTPQHVAKTHKQNESEGGPFIPLDSTQLNASDRDLIVNVDRMMLLHDIVEQLPISQPIEDAQTTGPFGKRVDPLNGRWAIHPGLDMAGPIGAKIFVTSNGTVVSAGHRSAYGNAVDVDHGFGIVTRYAHMSKILVKEGDTVVKGQQIGVQGSTGRSTGPHLHYEVRINDKPVNPVKFLQAGEYVSENE